MKKNSYLMLISAILFTVSVSIVEPNVSFASGTITVSNVPNVRPTSPGEGTALGTVFITIPQGALKNGDQVTFTLPHGFTFNSPFDTNIEKDADSLVSRNGAFVVSGFDHGDLVATATQLSNNLVTIKVIKTGIPTGDFKLAIKLGDIAINGVSDGPVNITFDAPSTSSFPTTTTPTSQVNQPAAPSDGSNHDKKKTAEFILGRKVFRLNGVEVTMDVAPYLNNNNRLMLPVRFVANALGVTNDQIHWNSTTQTVTMMKNNQVISFTVGQSNYILNGVPVAMDAQTEIKDGRVMVPFRYLAKALGAEITWDDSTKVASISY
jgi:trimeric autotransporter adhesin